MLRINSPCGRRGSGGWRQEWPSGSILFLFVQVSQNPVYDVLLLKTPVRRIGNDSDRPTATTADLDIDAENAFKALSPRHGCMALGW
jgi:hypothetical protein